MTALPALAAELAAAVRGRRVPASAAVDAAIDRAHAAEREAYTALVARHRNARGAFAGAEQVGGAVAARRRAARGAGGGVLAGVPFAAADDLADAALPTTCGSRALAGYVSPFEATAVARLLDAGAVLVGKTNVGEFGVGRTTETSAYGPTEHPALAGRRPGGASAGAAVAVAAGLVPFALGVDASGDVRTAAGHCGVVAVKATYGRVSRVGVVAHAASLAQVAAVGRAVDDAALALEVASGRDPLDPTSADLAARLRAAAGPVDDGRPLKGVRVGRARDAIADADSAVAARVEAALVCMRDLGAEVRDVDVPEAARVGPAHHALSAVEAASALARVDGVRFGPRADAAGVRDAMARTRGERVGTAVLRHVLLGTHLAADASPDGVLRRAQVARAATVEALVDLFRRVDLIVSPVSLRPAPTASAPTPDVGLTVPVDRADALVLAANLAGLPAASVPFGTADGLPVGVHLLGQHFGEALLVRAAAALERVTLAEAGA